MNRMKNLLIIALATFAPFAFVGHTSAKIKRRTVKHSPHYQQSKEIAAVDNVQQQIDALNALMKQKMEQEDPNATEADEAIPANGIYDAWEHSHVNPYQVPYYKIPDSVKIDMSQFVPPVETYITSHFGMRHYRFHYGTDLKLNTGDPVRCAFDGKVRVTGYDAGGYGNYIVVRHPNGLETVYGHLSKIEVSENQMIKAGDVIALGGSTGHSTGPHLHFEMRYLGNAISPEKLIDFSTFTPYNNQYCITQSGSFDYCQYARSKPESSSYKRHIAAKTHRASSGSHSKKSSRK